MGIEEMVLENELCISMFLFVCWVVEKALLKVLVSPVISNIATGMLLGPSLLNVVPYADAVVLAGKIGVMLLVIDSGMDCNSDDVKKIGKRAFLMGSTGVVVPVLITLAIYYPVFPEGGSIRKSLSVGAALAPTSLGVSAMLLSEAGILQTTNGLCICVAAVVDDVMALMLLGEMRGLRDMSVASLTWPIAGAFASVLLGLLMAVVLSKVYPKIPSQIQGPVGIVLAMGGSLAIGWVAAWMGSSDLIGCFIIGLVFSTKQEVRKSWDRHVSKIQAWLNRVFFAGTIAFSIPSLSGEFFSAPVFKRLALLLIPAVIGKMSSGIYATPLTWVGFCTLGWGMGGRGEFSFFIARGGFKAGLLSTHDYCATVWALIVHLFLAPPMLKYYLAKQAQIDGRKAGTTPNEGVQLLPRK